MKKLLALGLLGPALLVGHNVYAQYAGDAIVQWRQIVGVITAPNVDNPVAGISAGTLPWSVREGHARLNLTTGRLRFSVEGLVLNGGNASGTPGPVTSVTGTVVCNAGTNHQRLFNTPELHLSHEGDAHFRGSLHGIPANCPNPLFLVRIGPSFPTPAAVGRWLATGAERLIGDDDDDDDRG